ncbi:MAG TPA: AMP-dependent synthetase/ligase, partial [Lacipirellulaceae bacterium]|nr:AMP-dependent synthetase/ligase [Lacipirellulaceae bacterium]
MKTIAARPNVRALGFIRDGQLHWRTWREVATDAATLAAKIRAAGVALGDRVAHVSENRYEWIITDLALHLAGAVHVPIHATLSGQQIAEQITDCGARLAFVSSEDLLAKFATRFDHQIPVWLHDERPSTAPTPTSAFPPPRIVHPASSSLATILYTSGTTGRPRGVMLSHHNLACNAATVCAAHGVDPNHTLLCVLPLSHIYARTCDLYTWIVSGSRLVLAESRDTLVRDCQLAQPTALNAVPFVYQRVMEAVCNNAAIDEPTALRSVFGPQMKMLFCGGAPVAPDVEAWYTTCGRPLLTGYGMTEASPVVAVSTCRERRVGTVGPVLPGVEVHIADDGEILVRGPNIMLGYWKDEAATADAIRDGWFHTGDLGELDADGFLTVRGRKKELIVLSTGKKVSPTRVEGLLTTSPFIDQAAVFGDGQSGLVALIVPSDLTDRRTACGVARRDFFADEIANCLKAAAQEEQIHRFALLHRP